MHPALSNMIRSQLRALLTEQTNSEADFLGVPTSLQQIFGDVVWWRELFNIGHFDLINVQIENAFGIILPCAQAMLHLLIATNRFTAFFFPLNHSSIWNKRLTYGPILAVVVLSISVFVGTIYGLRLIPDDGSYYNLWNIFAYFYIPVCVA
jgi:hypothetical protein